MDTVTSETRNSFGQENTTGDGQETQSLSLSQTQYYTGKRNEMFT